METADLKRLATTNILTPKREKCYRCGRPLSNPISMHIGYGPHCSEALGIDRSQYDAIVKLEMEQLLDDPDLVDKLTRMREEMEIAHKRAGYLKMVRATELAADSFRELGDSWVMVCKLQYECDNFYTIKEGLSRMGFRWEKFLDKVWYKVYYTSADMATAIKYCKQYSDVIDVQEDTFTEAMVEAMAREAKPAKEQPPPKPDLMLICIEDGTAVFKLRYKKDDPEFLAVKSFIHGLGGIYNQNVKYPQHWEVDKERVPEIVLKAKEHGMLVTGDIPEEEEDDATTDGDTRENLKRFLNQMSHKYV